MPTSPVAALENNASSPTMNVTAVSPAKGPTAGGTKLTATGTGLETTWTNIFSGGTGTHAQGVASDGRIYGWANNRAGQLGSR